MCIWVKYIYYTRIYTRIEKMKKICYHCSRKRRPKMQQKEKEIEKRLTDIVRDKGGLCLKLASPGRIGVPDRIIIYPNGVVGFVELKRPGAVPANPAG